MYTHMFLHVYYPFSSSDTAKLSKIVFFFCSLDQFTLKKQHTTHENTEDNINILNKYIIKCI